MKEQPIIRFAAATSRRFAMRLHRLRVQAVLALWLIPDRALRAMRAARTMPPRRLLATVALTAAVLAPSLLYLNERARRVEFANAYRQLTFSSSAEIATLRHTMGNLLYEQSELKELLLDAGYAVFSDNELAVPVVVTGYSSSVYETDSTPFITAANTRTRKGIVALSRDLLKRYNPEAPLEFGDIVHISGVGDFVVEDSMNSRWRRRVDVWFPSRTAAVTFGRREVILRTRVEEGDNETVYRYSLPLNLASANGASP
jgi:3D (Asp-Asp-Asp) domain-containing protein